MAKLPPKPRNIVHEYFPIGSESPMNNIDGAFEAMLVAEGRHPKPVSYTHLPSPRDVEESRMPSSA